MSNVCDRRLIAGTVNPATSPRARARYSSWMLADRAPSSWAASHTIHCATSTVAGSSLKAAVQARSRIPSARSRATSSITNRPSCQSTIPLRRDSNEETERSTSGTGPLSALGSERGLGHHQEHDHDDQRGEQEAAALDALDQGQEPRRRTGRRT